MFPHKCGLLELLQPTYLSIYFESCFGSSVNQHEKRKQTKNLEVNGNKANICRRNRRNDNGNNDWKNYFHSHSSWGNWTPLPIYTQKKKLETCGKPFLISSLRERTKRWTSFGNQAHGMSRLSKALRTLITVLPIKARDESVSHWY